jgi:hypothetical protein
VSDFGEVVSQKRDWFSRRALLEALREFCSPGALQFREFCELYALRNISR